MYYIIIKILFVINKYYAIINNGSIEIKLINNKTRKYGPEPTSNLCEATEYLS